MLLRELWSGSVQTKKHPPEGIFASGSDSEIVDWLMKSHNNDKAKATSALNFYINRAGKNLSVERQSVLTSAKTKLSEK